MGTPHNTKRYGETWTQERIDAYLKELMPLKEHVILSGGWAWHFMSPEGHVELKHAHDHKDVDIYVLPNDVWTVMGLLQGAGFRKVKTKYDKLTGNYDFRRYEKILPLGDKSMRVTIDFFVAEVPHITARDDWRVVEPEHLLSLYSEVHSSDNCFAVQAAIKLVEKGESPVGRPELVAIPGE